MTGVNKDKALTAKARRSKVLQMSMRGFKTRQLAEYFNVSPRTIERDFQELKKDVAKREGQVDPWALMGFLSEKQRQRIQELWRILNEDQCSRNEKIRAIGELRQEDEFLVKRAQIAGLLPKDNITVLPPIQAGDGSNNKVQQQVNIYQTLLNIKKQEEQVENAIENEKTTQSEEKST